MRQSYLQLHLVYIRAAFFERRAFGHHSSADFIDLRCFFYVGTTVYHVASLTSCLVRLCLVRSAGLKPGRSTELAPGGHLQSRVPAAGAGGGNPLLQLARTFSRSKSHRYDSATSDACSVCALCELTVLRRFIFFILGTKPLISLFALELEHVVRNKVDLDPDINCTFVNHPDML